MSRRLEGRTALITGSGRNIGRAIAVLFAHEGANIIVNGHQDKSAVDDTVREIESMGGAAIGIMADVADPDAVASMIAQGAARFGSIDIAVNNVGRRKRQPLEEISIADWQDTINYNLNSAFYVVHHVLSGMRQRGWGRIINIAGYDAWTGHISQRTHNVAAKAGMHGLTKAVAREAGVWGITCNTVAPGAINTIRDESQYTHVDIEAIAERLAIKKAGDPEDIAQACLFIAGESGKFVTGQVIHVNGGEFML